MPFKCFSCKQKIYNRQHIVFVDKETLSNHFCDKCAEEQNEKEEKKVYIFCRICHCHVDPICGIMLSKQLFAKSHILVDDGYSVFAGPLCHWKTTFNSNSTCVQVRCLFNQYREKICVPKIYPDVAAPYKLCPNHSHYPNEIHTKLALFIRNIYIRRKIIRYLFGINRGSCKMGKPVT